jgi:hypothetical protein
LSRQKSVIYVTQFSLHGFCAIQDRLVLYLIHEKKIFYHSHSLRARPANYFCSESNHNRSSRSGRRQRQAGEILAGHQSLSEPGANPFSLLKLLLGMTIFAIPSPQETRFLRIETGQF